MSRKTLLPSDRPLALPRRGAVFLCAGLEKQIYWGIFSQNPVATLYARQLWPQFWQTQTLLVFCLSRCFLGAKIFANRASQKKQNHLIITHHQPIKHHHKQPWCWSSSRVSCTAWTLTFSLPHFGHLIFFLLSFCPWLDICSPIVSYIQSEVKSEKQVNLYEKFSFFLCRLPVEI